MRFEELQCREEIKKAVSEIGFVEATPIQESAIPLIMEGLDIIGQSQTGTGKTAAFGIPVIEKIDPSLKKPQALVLCPTRELALQVSTEIQKFLKYIKDIKVTAIYGGAPIDRQIKDLRNGVQIVIGTPGRVMDHMRRKTLKLDNLTTVVLDEADEMLNMGFREDIESILDDINEDKQMILFSATMPKSILNLTKKYQNDPQLVKITPKELTTPNVAQTYYNVKEHDKFEVLTRLLDINNPKLSIIFCNTKKKVDDIVNKLQSEGYQSDRLHGDMSQSLRLSVLRNFNKGKIRILVATDVAARGIDVEDVEAVFNYDVPLDEEYYVHRIGRTGRAGRSGKAFSLVTNREYRFLQEIMNYTKKKIDKEKIPSIDDVNSIKIEKYLTRIESMLEKSDLSKYTAIAEKLTSEHSTVDVVAAFLKMNLNLSYEETVDLNPKERSSRSDNRTRKPRNVSHPRKESIAGMTRFYINAGTDHNIKARDILGAITGETDVPGKDIGIIDLYDKYSFVELPGKYSSEVLDAMNRKRIKGKKIVMEVSNMKRGPKRDSKRDRN